MQGFPPLYAIYCTPRPLSPLALFGASVLGYASSASASVARIDLPGIATAELVDATTAPRKCGFHATQAAPFYLGDGHREANLLLALDRFCSPTRLMRRR